MKLKELKLTKCKVCHAKIGKGGRDHRFGVCDKHVNEKYKTKIHTLLREGLLDQPFAQEVANLLWLDYMLDPYTSTEETYPEEMPDEEYLDYWEQVEEIVRLARLKGITDPKKALQAFYKEQEKQYQQQHGYFLQ